LLQERDEVASKLHDQQEKCLSLQLELEAEKARRVQEELEKVNAPPAIDPPDDRREREREQPCQMRNTTPGAS